MMMSEAWSKSVLDNEDGTVQTLKPSTLRSDMVVEDRDEAVCLDYNLSYESHVGCASIAPDVIAGTGSVGPFIIV
jgi:hypothetical protein